MPRGKSEEKKGEMTYLRQSHNLSNSLLGKPLHSAQPTLFDEWLEKQTPETQARADREIQLIGFDLEPPEQRAVEATLKLIAREGYKTSRLSFTLPEWLAAYGVDKYLNANSRMDYSGKEKVQAITALQSVALRSGIIMYSRKNEDGTYNTVDTTGPLWTLIRGFEGLSKDEVTALTEGKMTEALTRKMQGFVMEANPIFLSEQDALYFYRPADLWQRMQAALANDVIGRRTPPHLYNFLTWLFSQAGLKRGEWERTQEPTLTLKVSFDNLARQCRLHKELDAGRSKRILEAFTLDAETAIKMKLLTAFDLSNKADMVFTFDASAVFAEIEAWNAQQLAKFNAPKAKPRRSRGKGGISIEPVNLSSMYPGELKKLMSEIDRQVEKIRARRQYDSDRKLVVDNSPEEKSAIETLKARRKEAQELIYGHGTAV